MGLLEDIVDGKVLRVIKVFLKDPEGLYHIHKAASAAGVPVATSHRIIHSLSEKGLLEVYRISKLKLYRLAKNQKTRKLGGLI